MNLRDISVSHEGIAWQKCLNHWSWLLKKNPEFKIWLVTKFGEIFVVTDDDEVWFVSTSGASFEKVAETREEFYAFIDNPENIEFYFMPKVIDLLESNGMYLNEGECYGFHVPLVFKEANLEVENFKVIDIESYLVALGDLFGKLQDIPSGEKVSFKVVP